MSFTPTKHDYVNNELVIVHSLGENTPGEFYATIKGVSGIFPEVTFYIVEWLDYHPGSEEWDCSVITSACIKKIERHYVDDEFFEGLVHDEL